MKIELKLLFLILLVLCARLSLAADLPPEYNVMVEYRSLYSQLGSSEDANEASMVKRRRLHRLERELKAAGLTDDEFEQLRSIKKTDDLSEAGKVARAKLIQFIDSYDRSLETDSHRLAFVNHILWQSIVPGLEQLVAKIPVIAKSKRETINIQLRILEHLGRHEHLWNSVVRREIMGTVPIFGYPMFDRDIPGLQRVYENVLNAKEETDFPAMNVLLIKHVNEIGLVLQATTIVTALSANPKYLTRELVEALNQKFQENRNHGYLFEVLRLMRHLSPQDRAPMVTSALWHLNHQSVDNEYFKHPVFNEDHFLELLSSQNNSEDNAAYLHNMQGSIFDRPEFRKRTDLRGLRPHIEIRPCEDLLEGNAE